MKITRNRSRIIIIQSLYCIEINEFNYSENDQEDDFFNFMWLNHLYDESFDISDVSFIKDSVIKIIALKDKLDEIIQENIQNDKVIIITSVQNAKSSYDKDISNLRIIDKSILRLGIFEMTNSDIDRKIVINEMINISKKLGNPNSYKFINSILDNFCKRGKKDG